MGSTRLISQRKPRLGLSTTLTASCQTVPLTTSPSRKKAMSTSSECELRPFSFYVFLLLHAELRCRPLRKARDKAAEGLEHHFLPRAVSETVGFAERCAMARLHCASCSRATKK